MTAPATIRVHIEVSLEATRLHSTHFPMHICFEAAGLQTCHSLRQQNQALAPEGIS
jgi:hypothetical protein